jgi:hypothetical protein
LLKPVAWALGFAWAWREAPRVRDRLGTQGGVKVAVSAPPTASPSGIRGVGLGLSLRRASCLERSLIVQRWYLSQGRSRPMLIGIAREGASTVAHAWLEGEERRNKHEYLEMTRVEAE